MFLALGVAALILLAGTDLSIGRMVGMGMTTATIIMHQGVNTGSVFGHIFDFTKNAAWSKSDISTCNVYFVMYSVYNNCRFLYRKIQNAPIYFNNGKHACNLRACYICDKRCILWCD